MRRLPSSCSSLFPGNSVTTSLHTYSALHLPTNHPDSCMHKLQDMHCNLCTAQIVQIAHTAQIFANLHTYRQLAHIFANKCITYLQTCALLFTYSAHLVNFIFCHSYACTLLHWVLNSLCNYVVKTVTRSQADPTHSFGRKF